MLAGKTFVNKFASDSWNVPFNKGICRSVALLDRKVRPGSHLSNIR